MSLEVTRLTPAQFEDGVDFINLVFSQNSVPHDFKNLTPRWTRPEYSDLNVAAMRDGRIRSLVMSAPAEIHVAGRTLKGFGIGNVSTHLDERRTGLMRMVMTRALEDMQKDGADLAFLGGYRQRYQYYGFERCGCGYSCRMLERNARHAIGEAPALTFRKMEGPTDPFFAEVKALYYADPLYINRGTDEQFWLTLKMWTNTPYVCLDADGKFFGYLCVSTNLSGISEIHTANDADCIKIMHAWLAVNGLKEVTVYMNPWRRSLIRALARVCESVQLTNDHQYRIFNWDKVVDAFMALKASYAPMVDGKAVISIGDWGKLSISVANGVPSVSRTDEPEDIALTEFQAVSVIFGPLEAFTAAEIPENLETLFAQWFPLPLSWHFQDCV